MESSVSFPSRARMFIQASMSAGIALLLAATALAVPVAVDDSYEVSEDLTLNTQSGPLISADFDSGSAGAIPFNGQWAYLDRIQNSEGSSQTYPTDGSGRTWNSSNFDPATSTIGPWGTTNFPVQGGIIDGFPGDTPVTLQGIGAAPNGNNLVTTYLFRNTFTLTAAQVAETNWIANLLVDDGCVIYINGSEVARTTNMPAGPLTTETLAGVGDESNYLDLALNVAGVLGVGVNTIAIEVHQTSLGSTDVGINLTLRAGAGSTGGFVYVDDVFGTNLPGNARGIVDPSGGFAGAGLRVTVGEIPPPFLGGVPQPTSGGFLRTFIMSSPATVRFTFRYRLTTSNRLEPSDYGEAVFTLDGVRRGNGTGNSLVRINDGGDSNWQSASFDLPLAAGNHTMILGAYSNETDSTNERIDALFDDVLVTPLGGGGGGVLENDTVGANPTAALVTGPSHGTLSFPPSGIFIYTPALNYNGPDSFTYRATDATGTSAPATVTINVLPVNDAPVVTNKAYNAVEDVVLVVGPASAGVLADATDVENQPLTAVLGTTTSNGTLVLNPDGTFRYTPAPNFFGTDSFTFRASDGSAQSALATVTITVASVPDPPTPQNDSYTVEENTTLVVSGVSGGSTEEIVSWNAVWRYNDTGTDLQTAWRAPAYNDSAWASGPAELGYGDGDEATVVGFGGNTNNRYPTTYFRRTFQVPNVNTISACRLWIRRDDGCVVFLNGTQVAIDNIQANPVYSTLASNATDDGNSQFEFTVNPALFTEGPNTLAVEIHQSAANSTDISFALRMEITRTIALTVLANDSDPDGQPLTASLQNPPSHGSVNLNPDGTFTYTPALNYEGVDTFTYLANNGNLTAPATVTITITPGPNNLPETQPDTYAVTEDTPFTRTAQNGVLSNDLDPDGDPLTALLKSSPTHGSLLFNPNGSFTYTPAPNFFGPDSFTYAAFDGTGESPPQTVTLNVANTPDAPIAQPDVYVTNPGQNLFVPVATGVLANDSDPDGTIPSAVLVTNVASGTLNLFSNGSFFYNPANSNPGTVTFTYRASDGVLTSALTTVTIHLDTAPVAVADSFSTAEDTALNVSSANGLLKNDTDPENDPLTASIVTPPSNGTASVAANGSFTYTPAKDYHGQDTFTYRASDGPRFSPPATVTITVTPVNDPPVAVADSYNSIIDQDLVVNAATGVLANDFDVDNGSLTAALITQPSQGALAFNPDGSFAYTPSAGFTGVDSFTYQASDGLLSSFPATVTLQIGASADSIVINEIMYHPSSELDAHEFIELTNLGDGSVNLNGWSFTSGLSFTFPDVNIPAGGFLVVAADPTAFTAHYGPVDRLVGGWIGSLSNSGERIKLVDADGLEVDDLEYSDQGDWAIRTRVTDTGVPGWVWEAAHDGGGSSLELINPRLTNKAGANWRSSAGAPTPGALNSVVLPESAFAPLILDVEHTPRIPRSTDTVTIRAALRDTGGSFLTATLHYRVSTANTADPFLITAMVDDGLHNDGDPLDGLFAASLPAMAEDTIIEFYISAADGVNRRTWPAPTSIGQVANALYQVDNEAPPAGQGIYRLILPVPENQRFNGIDRDSNAQMHCTLVADDCSGPVVRYSCGMRVRGASSRADTPPPMRVNIPRDRPWNGVTAMNLNSQFTWLQFIGMKLFQASDLAAPDTKRIAVRRNSADPTRGTIEDFGSFVYVQPLAGDFVDAKYPGDRQGNLYKKVRPDVDWAYRAGNFARYPQDGWGKETNSSENDWTDLDEFLRVMNQTPGAPDYIAQVEAVANLDQWMRWFAVEALIANGETNASNGADDDYSMYRGVVDPRFTFIPHDLDTILGAGDGSRITNPQHTIFDMLESGDILNPLVPLFNDPAIRTRYYQALRLLIQTSFSKPNFDALVRNHLTGWVPQQNIDGMITFMDARRTYITGLVNTALGPPTGLTEPTTLASLDASAGNPRINEVLAVNRAAHANGGGFPDYIELYNSGTSSVSLAGYSLTDDPAFPQKYVFPAGASIALGQYLLLYADSATGAPGVHLGFGLNAGGEGVYFYNAAGVLVDSVLFGPQVPDLSIGRVGAGGTLWRLNQPTPGLANVAQNLGAPATLRLNEWLAKPELVFAEDFVEIYNPDPLPVSLGGLRITDDPLNYPQRAVLPALSFIAGNGFALFEPVGASNVTPGNASELPFKIEADLSWIAIYGANGVEIDRVHALCDARDQSQGRATDGSVLFARFAVPTPGISNSTNLAAQSLILQSLRVTEIMYNPATGGSNAEFIELRNVGSTPINLLGVSFTKGIDFTFPNMTLNPGQYVVVVADLAVFTGIYGGGINVAGEWTGKLDNDQDRVRLEIDYLNAGILDFTYKDGWYPSTDGGGYSLVIINSNAEPAAWREKTNWTAGSRPLGTPGMDEGFFVFAGTNQVVNLPASATLNATVLYGSLNPATVTLAWSLENGPAAAQFGNAANEDTTVTAPMPGLYTFELIATPQVGPPISGFVTVLFRDTYANWTTTHFGGPLVPGSGKLDNPDLDGFPNLLEFVLGLDPNAFNSAGLLEPVLDPSGALSLVYFRRYLDSASITITPEISSDLQVWQGGPAVLSQSVMASTVDGEFIKVVDLTPVTGNRSRFLRLRVDCLQ